MRATLLVSLLALGGCSFIDDFDSFREPDSGGVDAGTPAAGDGGVAADAGDAATPDGGTSCATGLVDCDGNPATPCVDPTTSRAHCGGCSGAVCAANESCIASTCAADPVVQLTAGAAFACALRMSGQVQCWGGNAYGQLGTGAGSPHEDTPRDVVGLPEPAAEIAAGYQHVCARSVAGHVYCWGENYYGELGNASVPVDDMPHPTPQTVTGLANTIAIAAGYDSSCALVGPAAGAHVTCWGSNEYGELGQDITDHPASSMPLDVTLTGGVPLALGCGKYDEYTCAALTAGSAQCWGSDDHDERGTGGTAGPTPAAVMGADGFVDIQTGATHICGRTMAGSLLCWGEGDADELGRVLGGTSDPSPRAVPGLSAVAAYAVGVSHTCAIGMMSGDASPNLYCFGANAMGELGIGGMTSMNFDVPQRVVTAGTFAEVVAGDGFSCARRTDVTTGAVVCWGDNGSGQTGSGDSGAADPRHLSPVAVMGL